MLSNVEKRFGLASKEVAWVYSGNEISQIALVFFLPLIGQVRKRPLWLGVSNCAAAVGILIIALPHFISKLFLFLLYMYFTLAHASCLHVLSAKKYVPPGGSGTGSQLCQTSESSAEQCPDGEAGDTTKDIGSMGIIFFGIFVSGFANSLFYAFGQFILKLVERTLQTSMYPSLLQERPTSMTTPLGKTARSEYQSHWRPGMLTATWEMVHMFKDL